MREIKVALYRFSTESDIILSGPRRLIGEAEDGTMVVREITKGQVAVNLRALPSNTSTQFAVGETSEVRKFLIRNGYQTSLIALDRWVDRKKKPVTILARWLRMRPAELEGALTELDLELVRKDHKQ